MVHTFLVTSKVNIWPMKVMLISHIYIVYFEIILKLFLLSNMKGSNEKRYSVPRGSVLKFLNNYIHESFGQTCH